MLPLFDHKNTIDQSLDTNDHNRDEKKPLAIRESYEARKDLYFLFLVNSDSGERMIGKPCSL